jgi:hypothetical protein
VGQDGRAAQGVSLVVRLAEMEENPQFPPEAFVLSVPADARALTLEELRGHGMRLGGT